MGVVVVVGEKRTQLDYWPRRCIPVSGVGPLVYVTVALVWIYRVFQGFTYLWDT